MGKTTKRVTMSSEDIAAAISSQVLPDLAQREFSTGSVGFRASGKVGAGDERYQVSVQCVLIGSRPAA